MKNTQRSSTNKQNLKQSNNQNVNLSVVMIGHNERQHLAELLPTLTWVKEIVYVDCESSDDSLALAQNYKCRIFKQPNNMNPNSLAKIKKNKSLIPPSKVDSVPPTFGIASNKSFAIKQAKCDWVLLLDPDERIDDELTIKIKDLLSDDNVGGFGGYYINRKNYYLGKFLQYGENYPDWQLRLFHKDLAFFSHLNVHEHLEIRNKPTAKLTQGVLHHYTYESIFDLIKKNNLYSSFEVESIGEDSIKIDGTWSFVNFMLLKPCGNFLNRFFFKRGFLDGFEGFVFAFFNAFKFQLRYLKLKERKKRALFKPK